MAKAAPRNAILTAMKLLGEMTGGDTVASSAVRSVVAQMMDAGTYEALAERYPDLGALLRSLLCWNGNTVSDEVVDAAVELVGAEDRHGRSMYQQATSLLSYAAAVAPMVSDQVLLELIEAGYVTVPIYSPIKYTATVTAPLTRMLRHYPEETRGLLAVSLWEVAHEGRWWDRNSAEGRKFMTGELSAGLAHQLWEESDSELLTKLGERALSYDPGTAARLTLIDELGTEEKRVLRQTMITMGERFPDVLVLSAHLWPLDFYERPESPITRMVDSLEKTLAKAETTPEEGLPRRPISWRDLYPAMVQSYPIPERALRLEGKPLRGIPGSRVSVIKNYVGLADEARYMENELLDDFVFSIAQGNKVVFRVESPLGEMNVVLTVNKNGAGVDPIVIGKYRGGIEELDRTLAAAGESMRF